MRALSAASLCLLAAVAGGAIQTAAAHSCGADDSGLCDGVNLLQTKTIGEKVNPERSPSVMVDPAYCGAKDYGNFVNDKALSKKCKKCGGKLSFAPHGADGLPTTECRCSGGSEFCHDVVARRCGDGEGNLVSTKKNIDKCKLCGGKLVFNEPYWVTGCKCGKGFCLEDKIKKEGR